VPKTKGEGLQGHGYRSVADGHSTKQENFKTLEVTIDDDPMMYVEWYHARCTEHEQQKASHWRRALGESRKAIGLSLMAIGKMPISPRYRFYFCKKTYLTTYRTEEMKKRESTPAGEVARAAVADPSMEKKFPRVWEYMTLLHFDDGTARDLSKLSIFVENGKVKCALNDPAERASLYVAADTLEGALKALEATLGQENPEWRAWNHSTKKK